MLPETLLVLRNSYWRSSFSRARRPALFVLVRKFTADKVLEGLKGEGGTVLKTSLDQSAPRQECMLWPKPGRRKPIEFTHDCAPLQENR